MKLIKLVSLLMIAVMLLSACESSNVGKEDGEASGALDSAGEAEGSGEMDDAKGAEEVFEKVTLTYLNCWNGSGVIAPEDPINNPVANAIREKTGITLDAEYATTAEIEKLNLIFASGDMPDIINAPFWGGSDPVTQLIKKAAREGLLMPIDEYLDKYPNVKAAISEGVAKDFIVNDLEDPSFEGKHYIIPWQTAKNPEDITNWAYNLFARKDILDSLGVNPEDITTSEALYELLVKIKEGGFTDINGNPVIPGGTWANGWTYEPFVNGFRENNLTEFTVIDGEYRYDAFMPQLDEQVKFMRTLVTEGLFDMEAFRQSDSRAKEKMITGQIAMFGAHYPHVKQFFESTLYETNPEMEFVPVGPILDADGEVLQVGGKQLAGRAGSPVLFISSNCDNPEAAVKLIDFLNSEEGRLLTYYGIEGVHYDMVDGLPTMKDEWIDKYNTDAQLLRNEGIHSVYSWFTTLDSRLSEWGETIPGEREKIDEKYEIAKQISPISFADGYRVNYFGNDYKEIEAIRGITNYDTRRDALESAYFADSDEAAMEILESYRQQLISGGIEAYEAYINAEAGKRDDVIN